MCEHKVMTRVAMVLLAVALVLGALAASGVDDGSLRWSKVSPKTGVFNGTRLDFEASFGLLEFGLEFKVNGSTLISAQNTRYEACEDAAEESGYHFDFCRRCSSGGAAALAFQATACAFYVASAVLVFVRHQRGGWKTSSTLVTAAAGGLSMIAWSVWVGDCEDAVKDSISDNVDDVFLSASDVIVTRGFVLSLMSTIFSLVAAVCLCVSFDGREDLDEDDYRPESANVSASAARDAEKMDMPEIRAGRTAHV